MEPISDRLKEIFALALEKKSPAEREHYLAGACQGQPELRQQVESLLQAHAQASGFLDKTMQVSASTFGAERAGAMIGRYKLLELIGEGGFGSVWMAGQEEPVRRRVALKVIKPGMDTKQVLARFESERQALAMMDHPSIARVFDGGATDTGRPYFVMELVRGQRITDYCDANKLSTRERLGLFIQVCQAVQHAHQKGIIHRDLKPSNILVTEVDGAPVPKVIDFGVAKATAAPLTELTLFTGLHQMIGTPAYMSPEQAGLGALDMDTRSDIYALGVLLYELLTGQTPLTKEDFDKAGMDEIFRLIREQDPPKPSTRMSDLTREELTAIAARRQVQPVKLNRLFRGDLDWIVMKALEKDRTRRYETANGLAFDLRRHLNNEPVLARPASAAYKFQKAFRRNKLVFAAGTAIAAALVLGIIGTALGLLRAEKQRLLAETARQEESKLREMALKSLEGEKKQRARAETQELAARRIAYDSDMILAQQALTVNNLGRAQRLLDRQRPQPGQLDLRGWEWRYLWSQTRPDEHDVFLDGNNLGAPPLSFSPDGRLLARELNGVTVVTDLISRRPILQRTNAWHPVFSHHGTNLAFVDSSSTNDLITLLDIATQKETQLVTSPRPTDWFGFTPDDRRLLTVSVRPNVKWISQYEFPGDVRAWDVNTGRQLWQRAINLQQNGNGSYRTYAISPDGTALGLVLMPGRVQVLETQDGRERFTIKVTEEGVAALMFSPDSSTLVTAHCFADSAIRLWDAHSGQACGSLEGHTGYVGDLLFTPDSKLLISSGGDQTIRLWDWPTRQPAGVLRGHLNEVYGLALAPDGRTLASRCKDGSIYLWDITKPARHLGYQTLPSRLNYSSAVFTPDSRSILGVEPGGGVAGWDAGTLKETRRLWGDTNRNKFTIFPDASRVVQGDGKGRLHVWDARSGLETTNFVVAPGTFGWSITDNAKLLNNSRLETILMVWSCLPMAGLQPVLLVMALFGSGIWRPCNRWTHLGVS
jgi:WD40 repeat protein